MAEIGLAASIIAVIQLTGQVAGLSLCYIGGVKGASKNIRELASELTNLSQVLNLVLDYAETNSGQPTALELLSGKDGPLQKCANELEGLQTKLKSKSKGGMIGSLIWPLTESEAMRHISWVERQKSLFRFALTVDNITLSKAIHESVQGIEESLEITKRTIQVGFAAQSDRQQQDDLRLKGERRKRALDWLYSGDPNLRHNEIKNIRQEGTGQWLLKRSEFVEWAEQRQARRLLLGYGIPGAGKTFLSSIAIDYFRSQTTGYGVAHIYFNYKEQEKQKPTQILSSLVRQLANQVPDLPAKICELYGKLEKKGERPAMEELYTTLLEVSKSFTQVFLIFDALDECDPETQRKVLLPLFGRMGKDGIHVFLTSRPHPQDIQDSLCDASRIELSAQDEDIATYVQKKIEGHPRAKPLISKAKCMDGIISGLIECAKGMFLLVRFQVEYLCQQTTARKILGALERLKSSSSTEGALHSAYERAVNTIRRQDESSRDLAFKVLSWLVKARRTLTVEELRVGISVEPDRYELDELDLPDPTTLIDVCASLVTIDEGTIRLSHYTVQEYLQETSLIPTDAEFNLAMACTTYLSFDTLAQGPCTTREDMDDRLKVHPFLDYAAHHLDSHLKACDEKLSTDMYLNFIENRHSIPSWKQAFHYRPETLFEGYSFYSYPPGIPLQIASNLGHLTAVRLLLDNGADPLTQGTSGYTALHYAARNGHEAVVGLLLDRGADTTTQNNYRHTALHYAAKAGHEAVVGLLLDHGADTTARNNYGYTALHCAAEEGHEAVVGLLLKHGADTTTQDNYGRTALHRAAKAGHEAMVELLLNRGADTTTQNEDGKTALHYAAKEGHEAVVGLLLDRGADTTTQDDYGRTALHQTAKAGHEAVVGLLLDRGADTTTQNNDGYTALHHAAEAGYTGVVRLMLDHGADTTTQNIHGYTALHYAAEAGHETMVGLLLDYGADITAQNKHGTTAFLLAAEEGHETVVELLLDKGADISSYDKDGDTALHCAAYDGHNNTINLLLDKGANSSVSNNKGKSPLDIASEKNHQETVDLLLEIGCSSTNQDPPQLIRSHH